MKFPWRKIESSSANPRIWFKYYVCTPHVGMVKYYQWEFVLIIGPSIQHTPLVICNMCSSPISDHENQLVWMLESTQNRNIQVNPWNVLAQETKPLLGGWPTPLKNMKVTWHDYSQYMGKKNVPNHQPNPIENHHQLQLPGEIHKWLPLTPPVPRRHAPRCSNSPSAARNRRRPSLLERNGAVNAARFLLCKNHQTKFWGV